MMSSKYERELRDLFTGEEETIHKHTKTISEDVMTFYESPMEKPFGVCRGAGSLGIDLILMRSDLYVPIEVKSSGESTIYFDSDRLRDQAEAFVELSEQTGMPILFAQRHKGRSGEKWSIFSLDTSPTTERFPIVPKIPKTSHGHRKLEFEKGEILSTFISKLYSKVYTMKNSLNRGEKIWGNQYKTG